MKAPGTRTSPAAGSSGAAPVSPRRWLILAGYSLLAAATQLLWLTFAPIDTRSAAAMGVDVGTVGDLAAVFPFVYIVLALPTGRWLDSRFGQALAAGALLTAGGALLRLADPASFGWQLAGQLVIAAGQPLVLNSITKVAARHFAPAQRALAISIGSVALFAGILAAVLGGGPLLAAGGLPFLLGIQAAAAVVAAGLVLATLRIPAAYPDDPSAAVTLRWLAHDRFMWLLASLVFIGMGTYNAVATWLQPILAHYGEGDAAGEMVALLTFGGIIGAALIPSAVARADRRRDLLLAAVAISTVAFAALELNQALVWVGAWLFAAGVVLLASLPVVLEWSEVHSGPERQGAAVGFLLMAGNLGGLLLVLLVQVVIGSPSLALGAIAVASAAGIPLALRLPARTRPAAAGGRP
jgi:predicted MFS family arabinose efflux permease